jgi:hypothetical protein
MPVLSNNPYEAPQMPGRAPDNRHARKLAKVLLFLAAGCVVLGVVILVCSMATTRYQKAEYSAKGMTPQEVSEHIYHPSIELFAVGFLLAVVGAISGVPAILFWVFTRRDRRDSAFFIEAEKCLR